MSEVVLAEGLYVKRSTGNMGIGGTARECLMESLWFPLRAENGFVELFPVMDNLKSLLKFIEKIPVELFKQEYSVKDDSREIYLELKKLV
jgi:hypothetical protein